MLAFEKVKIGQCWRLLGVAASVWRIEKFVDEEHVRIVCVSTTTPRYLVGETDSSFRIENFDDEDTWEQGYSPTDFTPWLSVLSP